MAPGARSGPGPTGLDTYECHLDAVDASGQVWQGPAVSAGSNGTDLARGTCRQVKPYDAYYVTVQYVSGGVAASAASQPFLCCDYGAVRLTRA